MSGIIAAVTYKELGSAGVSSGMGHGKDTPVVMLVITIKFTVDGVTWSSCSVSVRTTTLDHKIGYNTVKCQTIVKPLFRQFYKIIDRIGSIFLIKLNFHYTLFGMDLSFFHTYIF